MTLSASDENGVNQLLKQIDAQMASNASTNMLIDFFTLITDETIDRKEFEHQIALLFKGKAELFDKVKEAIVSSIQLRILMYADNDKAAAIRTFAFEYFSQRLDEVLKFDVTSYDQGADGFKAAEEERKEEKKNLESEISQLQEQYQLLHEEEVAERKLRQSQKKEEEDFIKQARQFDHDAGLIERRMRREKIKRQIEQLSARLQEQHDNAIRAQKIIRFRKMAKIKIQAARQLEEQSKQAKSRKEKKEKELEMMKARQQLIQEQQNKQSEERAKKKKSYGSYLRDNLSD